MEYHDLDTTQMFDVRRNTRREVSEDEVIYAVHRVVLGNAAWFHHGVIISDGLDRTCDGLLKLQQNIFADSSDKAQVTPIFLRSLVFTDPHIMKSVQQEMNEQIAEIATTGDKEKFIVLGLVGSHQLTLLNVSAPDAFIAAANAAEAVNAQHGEAFVPVNVSFALPVMGEIYEHFNKTAAGIKAMLGAPVQRGYVH